VHTLKEAQQQSAELLSQGQGVLLVDTTLGNVRRIIDEGNKRFAGNANLELYARMIISALHGGSEPTDYTDLIASWTGLSRDHIQTLDIRNSGSPQELDTSIKAVLFSGSPSHLPNIGSGKEIRPGITDADVYNRSLAVWREAVKAGLPEFGICYGLQRGAKHVGMDILQQPGRSQAGEATQIVTQEGVDIISMLGCTTDPSELAGRISAFRSDEVQGTPDPRFASILFTPHDLDPSMVFGLIHNPQGTGTSPEIIKQVLAAGQSAGLDIQGHPEIRRGERARISAGAGRNLDNIPLRLNGSDQELSTAMLKMMTEFFRLHKRAERA